MHHVHIGKSWTPLKTPAVNEIMIEILFLWW